MSDSKIVLNLVKHKRLLYSRPHTKSMQFHVITIFPDLITSYTNESIIGRAQDEGDITVSVYDPREFTEDSYNSVDEKPYGGGPGMVMKAEPLLKTIDSIDCDRDATGILIFEPDAEQFTNDAARDLLERYDEVIMICGRYEGIDARVPQVLCNTFGCDRIHRISLGPFVLTGGELPALAVIDATTRQIPGVLGNDASLEEGRSAGANIYTRPETFEWEGKEYHVPEILLSGHHEKIEEWKKNQ